MTADKDTPKEFNIHEEISRVRDEIMNAPAPGTDPDSLRRKEKHDAAVNVYADDAADAAESAEDDKADSDKGTDAAAKRKAAGTTRTTTPQGRSATPTPTQKTAE